MIFVELWDRLSFIVISQTEHWCLMFRVKMMTLDEYPCYQTHSCKCNILDLLVSMTFLLT